MVGVGTAPLWLARTAFGGGPAASHKILVAIFLRGAVDGLNVVVPHGEKRYYDLRPSIAVPAPGAEGGAIELDERFGLHPSLAALKPIYDAGQLAVVHAAGSPDPTRSHFDAQDYMEAGTPGLKSTPSGWLNRSLTPGAGGAAPVRAIAMGKNLPRTLRGPEPALAIDDIGKFEVKGPLAPAFQTMYEESVDAELRATGRETFEAVALLKSIEQQAYTPAGGAEYPKGKLGPKLEQIARLIKSGAGVEVAFADIGGWDHHTNETPQLTNLLRHLGDSLAAFHRDLGDQMEDIVVVTMSEFGRTAKENGNRGTDHGHGNVMLALGGSINGGRVHGPWPGLDQEQLYEGRDLAVATDFRNVLGELVTGHLGVSNPATVFPDYQPDGKLGLL